MSQESSGLYAALASPAYKLATALRLHRKPMRIAVREIQIPTGLGLRLALLADIHADPKFMTAEDVELVVARAREHGPFDAVLIPGDLAGHDESGLAGVVAALTRFEAQVYFSPGNHDHMVGTDKVVALLKAAGIRTLVNEAEPLAKGAWIAGLDTMRGSPDPGAAMSRVPVGAECVVLGHEPHLATMHGAALHLAGHTHHGQIRVAGLPPLWLPRHSKPYPAGLYEVTDESGRRWVYTTTGIGTTTFPVRIGCPPEVVVIDC